MNKLKKLMCVWLIIITKLTNQSPLLKSREVGGGVIYKWDE